MSSVGGGILFSDLTARITSGTLTSSENRGDDKHQYQMGEYMRDLMLKSFVFGGLFRFESVFSLHAGNSQSNGSWMTNFKCAWCFDMLSFLFLVLLLWLSHEVRSKTLLVLVFNHRHHTAVTTDIRKLRFLLLAVTKAELYGFILVRCFDDMKLSWILIDFLLLISLNAWKDSLSSVKDDASSSCADVDEPFLRISLFVRLTLECLVSEDSHLPR